MAGVLIDFPVFRTGEAGTVVEHADRFRLNVHVHIRRCDVAFEQGRFDREHTGCIDRIGTQQVVGIRHPDKLPLVVGKVEIVSAEWIVDPIRDFNQGRSVDVA
jgi:hypothetical protein